MLQRAASNAYSWWWASHIRTKQSKWLEQSLQDMGEKVQAVMKLIQEDGDTFAKRAEMYYKKRPELISFVEESFRAYQALAERYDHLSKELQNANSTLASAFPDQYQYPADDDYDDTPPRRFRRLQEKHNPNMPKPPSKFPAKNLKVVMALAANKDNNDPIQKGQKAGANAKKSGLTKEEAINEVDKLQKQILTLQTEKEFAKSSYEKGYSKYWDIEEQIPTLQERISKLQDEFGITQAIKDEEARTVMAGQALKSCQQTLAHLREKYAKAVEEAKAERLRIREIREKLKSLKGEAVDAQGEKIEESEKGDSCEKGEKSLSFDDEVENSMDSKDFEKLRDKIKEHFDVGPTGSLTVTEMAEKVDELVNKVISLESSVSSQKAIILRLRSETNGLHSQIGTLENDGKNTMNDQLASMEKKLKSIQDLNRDFEKGNSSLETHFTEARSNLDTMSEKLRDVKLDEDFQYLDIVKEKKKKKKEKKEKKEKKKADKLKSGASTPETDPDELKSSTTTPKESHQLKSSASIPSKKESAELQSAASTIEKDNNQVEKQPRDDGPKPTAADVGQSLASSNKQQVDPVKPQEPASVSKDDERKLTDPDVGQSLATSNKPVDPVKPQESSSVSKDDGPKPTNPDVGQSLATSNKQVDPLKSQEPASVSKDDESKLTNPDVGQSLATSNKQEVDPVKSQEPASVSKDDECKLTNPDVGQSAATSSKQEVDPVKPREPTSSLKDERKLTRSGVGQSLSSSKKQVDPVKPRESTSTPIEERKLTRSGAAQSLATSNKQEVERVEPQESASVPKDEVSLSREAKAKGTASKEEDETDWRQLFMNTKEEYMSSQRNFIEAEKKLGEMEQKTQDNISEIMKQLTELKNSNAKKDEELHKLRQKIFALQKRLEDYKNLKESIDAESGVKNEEPASPTEDDYDFKLTSAGDGHQISPLEEKLRADIDEILEENLDFWIRFSSSFAQIQKFQNAIKDLHRELHKLEGSDERKEGSGHGGSSQGSLRIDPALISDARPIYRHLREIQTELTVWMEQSEKLKDELQSRFSQLCNIEHDIKQALDAGAEDDELKFTSFQAAKFQGEVANMQQENHKVADELQAGMDHIKSLKLDVKRTVKKLDDELGFSSTQNDQDDSQARAANQNKVPLRSFIFGVKPQKKKQSIFAQLNPAMMNKRYPKY